MQQKEENKKKKVKHQKKKEQRKHKLKKKQEKHLVKKKQLNDLLKKKVMKRRKKNNACREKGADVGKMVLSRIYDRVCLKLCKQIMMINAD